MKQQNLFLSESASWGIPPYMRVIIFALLFATSAIGLGVDASAQGQYPAAPPAAAARPAPKKKFRLRITKGDLTGVSLKANKAKMTEVAAELSKRLGTQVILGPSMKTEAITVEFYDLLLEPALRLLAPRVYIDYEIRANAQPTLLGIYLLGQDDPNPAANAIVQSGSESMLIEGNTEDVTEQSEVDAADDPLQVELDDDNRLTIKSKKQPLVAVVMTIAEVLSVPAEIKYDSNEIIDTNIKDVPFEDAIARLSPNIRLYVRADLNKSQRTALRLRLVPPPAAKVADTGSQ